MAPSHFNSNRYLALAILGATAVGGWYSTLLLSNPANIPVRPTYTQWVGGALSLVVVVMVWLKKCLTILPYDAPVASA